MLLKNDSPLVSIIVPTFNGEKWIAQTLRSALRQTYKRLEVIVVDNGSQDKTLDIVEDFRRKDKRVKLIINKGKKGVAVSRNVGIRNSEGEYISFLDQDDIYLPFKTELQVRFMEQYPMVGLCYGGVISSDMRRYASHYKADPYDYFSANFSLIAETICGSCSTLIRREAFDVVGMLDEDINRADDYDFLCRVVKFFPIWPFPQSAVYVYRNHLEQSSFRDAGRYRWACDYAALKHFWSMEEKIWGRNTEEIAQKMWELSTRIYRKSLIRAKEQLHFPRFDTILEIMRKSQELLPSPEKQKVIDEIERKLEQMKEFRFSPYFPPAELIRLSGQDKEEIARKADEIKRKVKEAKERKPYFHDYFIKRRKKVYVRVRERPRIEIILVGGKDTNTIKSISSQGYPVYLRIASGLGEHISKDELKGDFVGFIFPGDILRPRAIHEIVGEINSGAQIIYTDEGYLTRKIPAMKPDFSPHTLEFFNYISQFTVMKKELLPNKISFEGFWFWDIIKHAVGMVRKDEKDIPSRRIRHIRQVLYVNRGKARWEIEKKEGVLTPNLKEEKLVSIIIPNKDKSYFLDKCVRSIFEKSTYKSFEVVVVENNSVERRTFELYRRFEEKFGERFRVLSLGRVPFNFSRFLNEGAKVSRGDVLLFLNNDTEVITPQWLEHMLYFAEMSDIGCVGAYLLFPDMKVQHIGVHLTTEYGSLHPEHVFWDEKEVDYFNIFRFPRDVTAVTGACLMVRRDVFEKLGGFDEDIAIVYGDIDFCLRAIKKGYFNIVTPYAKLIHHEKITRSRYLNEAEIQDMRIFLLKHRDFIERVDPFSSDLFYIKYKEKVVLMRWYHGIGYNTNVQR